MPKQTIRQLYIDCTGEKSGEYGNTLGMLQTIKEYALKPDDRKFYIYQLILFLRILDRK